MQEHQHFSISVPLTQWRDKLIIWNNSLWTSRYDLLPSTETDQSRSCSSRILPFVSKSVSLKRTRLVLLLGFSTIALSFLATRKSDSISWMRYHKSHNETCPEVKDDVDLAAHCRKIECPNKGHILPWGGSILRRFKFWNCVDIQRRRLILIKSQGMCAHNYQSWS